MDNNIRKLDINEFRDKITSYGFVSDVSGTYTGYDKLGCININEKSILIATYGHNERFDESFRKVIEYLYPSKSAEVLEILNRVYIDETIEEDGLTAYATGIKNNTFLRVLI